MMKLRPHQEHIVASMVANRKGQIIVPTGGGKTFCMIKDTERQLSTAWKWDSINHQFSEPKTIVVVAPRILLAEQLSAEFLEHIIDVKVLHVHSGDTHHTSTTKPKEISDWKIGNWKHHKLIFTTYHSLHRIQESGINVDTIYFDEAHNAVQRHFFNAVEFFSNVDRIRAYWFTATPYHSTSISHPGMNDEEVFGKVLCDVPAPELVDQGIILPPKVMVKKIDMPDDSRNKYERDCENILSTLDEIDVAKVLVCARNTKQIVGLVNQTHFGNQLQMRGYNVLSITAKAGAFINGAKVTRQKFFNTLNELGRDENARFVVMHHSILSEGMNVKGLEAALFLRNMNYIGISQTIGRVIRTGLPSKTYGLVVIPQYDRVGISTAKSINAVVDVVFNKGRAATTTRTR